MTISDDNQDARPMETAQDCINRNKPLPAGLTSVGGCLNLDGYAHPLPAGLTSVGGGLDLRGYEHLLPDGLTSVGGGLDLRGYEHLLPDGLTSVGGYLDLRGYAHPLPAGFISVGGDLDLDGYAHPLPAGLTSVGGHLYLGGYAHPLPPALAGDLPIPVIHDIDRAILAAIEAGGCLDMGDWHNCETTHCRAGWAVHLAGEAGYALEKRVGPAAAGVLIYEASRPGVRRPDFFATTEAALADLRRCAGRAP